MATKKIEVAKPCIVRFYKRQRSLIKRLSKELGISEAAVIRSAVEMFAM